MTTEERLENLERELARAKRRNRRLLGQYASVWTVVGLALVAWVMAGTVGPRTAKGQAEPKAVAETHQRLKRLMDLDFENMSLDNVLKHISKVMRLTIVIDPDVAAQGIDLPTRVLDLKVKGVSVESVLATVLGADLGYKVEAGYILVTTREKLQQNLPAVTHPVAAGAAVKEVRANRFVLVDENGRTGAMLSVDTDGPRLRLFDEQGRLRINLAVVKDGPRLDLTDKNGKPRAQLGVGRTVSPDGRGITYPESSLRLFGPDQTVVWQAP